MMSYLEKKLTKEWAKQVIPEKNRLISAIIFDLQEKGREIAVEIDGKDYKSLEDFLREHASGNTSFVRLEGRSTIEGEIVVLHACPLLKLLESLKGPDGKLPEYFRNVEEKYKDIYKNKGAILHPFCIVHQVIRSVIGEHTKVNGKAVAIYQIACRSVSGKVVYANEGMSKIKLSKEDVDERIDGQACMYLLKF
ncbi:MAG: hypothetical protein ACYDFU_03055 [Nitrospirota bacterium]